MATKKVDPTKPGQMNLYGSDVMALYVNLTPYQVALFMKALNHEWDFGRLPIESDWVRFQRPSNQHERSQLLQVAELYNDHPFTLKIRQQREDKVTKRQKIATKQAAGNQVGTGLVQTNAHTVAHPVGETDNSSAINADARKAPGNARENPNPSYLPAFQSSNLPLLPADAGSNAGSSGEPSALQDARDYQRAAGRQSAKPATEPKSQFALADCLAYLQATEPNKPLENQTRLASWMYRTGERDAEVGLWQKNQATPKPTAGKRVRLPGCLCNGSGYITRRDGKPLAKAEVCPCNGAEVAQ